MGNRAARRCVFFCCWCVLSAGLTPSCNVFKDYDATVATSRPDVLDMAMSGDSSVAPMTDQSVLPRMDPDMSLRDDSTPDATHHDADTGVDLPAVDTLPDTPDPPDAPDAPDAGDVGSEDSGGTFVPSAISPHPDIAFQTQGNQFLLVWGEDLNGSGEREILGSFLDETGQLIGATPLQISNQGPAGDPDFAALTPAVVYNSTANEHLVVWAGNRSADDVEIYGARVDALNNQVVGAPFRISQQGDDAAATALSAASPAIAWDSNEDQYLVVWSGEESPGEWEVYYHLLDATGNRLLPIDPKLSSTGPGGDLAFQATNPDVAFAGNTYSGFHVVWSADATAGEKDLFNARVEHTTGMIARAHARITHVGPDGDPAYGAFAPAIACNGGNCLVVWWGDDRVDQEFEIFGQKLAMSGSIVGTSKVPITSVGPESDTRWGAYTPDLETSADGFVLTYSASEDWFGQTVAGEYEIWAVSLDVSGGEVAAADKVSTTGPNGNTSYGAYLPAVALNPTKANAMVVWQEDLNQGVATEVEHVVWDLPSP